MNDFRELCHGKDFVRPPNNRNMKESPRKKCPLPLMFCAREPPASSQLTSTTADLSDSRRSQTTGKTDKSIPWRNDNLCFQLPPATIPEPFSPPRLYLRLRLRLEHAQVWRKPRSRDRNGAEICKKMRGAE